MAARKLIRLVLLTLLLIPGSAWAIGAPARLSALQGVEVDEEVNGDVIVLAGDLRLGDQAWVRGHAIAILGSVDAQPGARVDGRIIAVESLASLSLHPESQEDLPYLDAAVRILSSGGWLLVTTGLTFFFPGRVRRGAAVVRELPVKVVILGLMVTLTLFVALVTVLGFGPALGVPLAATLMMLFFIVKAVGLAALGGTVGLLVLRHWTRSSLPLTFAVFAGVGLMLLIRLVPFVGGAAWALLSLAALGVGVFTLIQESRPQPAVV